MTQDHLYIWAAGLLDGEAHISTVDRINTRDYVRLSMAQTHKATVERVKSIFGRGNVTLHRKADEKGGEAWRWYCDGDDARQVLLLVRPFLFTKAENTDLVLTLSDPNNHLTTEVRNKIRNELRLLLKRKHTRPVVQFEESQLGAAE